MRLRRMIERLRCSAWRGWYPGRPQAIRHSVKPRGAVRRLRRCDAYGCVVYAANSRRQIGVRRRFHLYWSALRSVLTNSSTGTKKER